MLAVRRISAPADQHANIGNGELQLKTVNRLSGVILDPDFQEILVVGLSWTLSIFQAPESAFFSGFLNVVVLSVVSTKAGDLRFSREKC